MASETDERRRGEEPIGEVHSFLSQVLAFRHQVSKYGYVRGALRHAKRQAVRWQDIVGSAQQKGTAEYRARKADTDTSVRYYPGIGVLIKGGGATGPRRLYIIGAVLEHYLQILFRLVLFLVLLPLMGVMGVLLVLSGLFELDLVLGGAGLLMAVVCLGAVYWLRTADVDSGAATT